MLDEAEVESIFLIFLKTSLCDYATAKKLRHKYPVEYDKRLLALCIDTFNAKETVFRDKELINLLVAYFYVKDCIGSTAVHKFLEFLSGIPSVDGQLLNVILKEHIKEKVNQSNDRVLRPYLAFGRVPMDARVRKNLENAACLPQIALQLFSLPADAILPMVSGLRLEYNEDNINVFLKSFIAITTMNIHVIPKAVEVLCRFPEAFNVPFNDNMKFIFKSKVAGFLMSKLLCEDFDNEPMENPNTYIGIFLSLFDKTFIDRRVVIDSLEILAVRANVDRKIEIVTLPFVEAFETIFRPEKMSKNNRKRVEDIAEIFKKNTLSVCSQEAKNNIITILKTLNTEIEFSHKVSDAFESFMKRIRRNEDLSKLSPETLGDPFSANTIPETNLFLENITDANRKALAKTLKDIASFNHVGDKALHFVDTLLEMCEVIFQDETNIRSSTNVRNISITKIVYFIGDLIEIGVIDWRKLDFFVHHLFRVEHPHAEAYLKHLVDSAISAAQKRDELKPKVVNYPRSAQKVVALYVQFKSSQRHNFKLDEPLSNTSTSRMVDALYDCGMADSEACFAMFEICLTICSKPGSEYKMKQLKRQFETRTIKLFERKIPGNDRIIDLCLSLNFLVREQLISNSAIFNVIKTYAANHKDLIGLVAFITLSKDLIRKCEDKSSAAHAEFAEEKLRLYMMKPEPGTECNNGDIRTAINLLRKWRGVKDEPTSTSKSTSPTKSATSSSKVAQKTELDEEVTVKIATNKFRSMKISTSRPETVVPAPKKTKSKKKSHKPSSSVEIVQNAVTEQNLETIELKKQEPKIRKVAAWMKDEETAKLFIDQQMSELSDENLPSKVDDMQQVVEHSEEIMLIFIRKIWEIVILNPESIEVCCKLLKKISNSSVAQQSGNNMKFVEHLMVFLNLRNETFSSIPCEQYSKKIKNRLGQVIMFVAVLCQLEVISDDFLTTWLQPNLTHHLSMEQSAKLCALLSDKTYDTESIQLKVQLMTLDKQLNKEVKIARQSMQREII